ncbi:MAG TPA: hypothetical protein VGD57_11030 [Candidatus Dormibacteraeota bacterium]
MTFKTPLAQAGCAGLVGTAAAVGAVEALAVGTAMEVGVGEGPWSGVALAAAAVAFALAEACGSLIAVEPPLEQAVSISVSPLSVIRRRISYTTGQRSASFQTVFRPRARIRCS